LGIIPVGVGSRRLGPGAPGQRRRVEDGRAAVEAGRRGGVVVDGLHARLGVGDPPRHDEDPAVDDDHDHERQVERADRRVELVADRLRQLTTALNHRRATTAIPSGRKKRDTKLLPITSPSINRFSKKTSLTDSVVNLQ